MTDITIVSLEAELPGLESLNVIETHDYSTYLRAMRSDGFENLNQFLEILSEKISSTVSGNVQEDGIYLIGWQVVRFTGHLQSH